MRDLALRTLEIGKKRVLVYRFFEIEEEESVARYVYTLYRTKILRRITVVVF